MKYVFLLAAQIFSEKYTSASKSCKELSISRALSDLYIQEWNEKGLAV